MANSWWEIQVLCDTSLDEMAFWRLEKFGCRGTSSEIKGSSCRVSAYLPQQQAQLLDLSALSLLMRQDALCMGLPIPIVQWSLIDEEDWASSWKGALASRRKSAIASGLILLGYLRRKGTIASSSS